MHANDDLLTAYDQAEVNNRYWLCLILVAIAALFEFFDFFVAGFLVAAVGTEWGLTFGQSSWILTCGGLGAMAGALIFGLVADRWGRKRAYVAGLILCGLGGGLVSMVPDGGWEYFSALRFAVGAGMGGATVVSLPLVVEMTPTRHRTIVTGVLAIPVSLGILMASMVATWLMPVIGWRGVAALGFLPLVPTLLIALLMPESVRWLISHGHFDAARRAFGQVTRGGALHGISMSPSASVGNNASDYRELFSKPSRLLFIVVIWFGASTATYGVILWGPTIVAQLLATTPAEAARVFVYVSLAGIVGRVFFALAPHWFGRRRCGELMGYGTAICLGAAALFGANEIAGFPLFIVLIIVAALFFDGGFANLAPYSAEIFPVRLAARGVALAQLANGMGKIAGPLCLAFIAGTGSAMSRENTAGAADAVFLFLAACGLAVGLGFTFLGIETHGRVLALGSVDNEIAEDGTRRTVRP